MAIQDLAKSLENAVKGTVSGTINQLGSIAGVTADKGTPGYGDTGYYLPYDSNDDAGNWGGGWGYGFGSSGGGRSAAEAQEENQAAINNAAGMSSRRGRDMDKLGQDSLSNISDQIAQNVELYKQTRRRNMQNVEWQPQQQKEQSTLSALRSRMGNAANGSGLVDLMEGLARVDDMADNALINTFKQNSDAAYDNWFQANEDLISDYIEQAIAIQDEYSKLFSQYWSTISNINPKLASEGNIDMTARNESDASVGEGTDAYTLPKSEGIMPSDALREMFKAPERASAINPLTRYFYRPDRANDQALRIPNTGNANRSTSANSGFNDNLSIYRRRV